MCVCVCPQRVALPDSQNDKNRNETKRNGKEKGMFFVFVMLLKHQVVETSLRSNIYHNLQIFNAERAMHGLPIQYGVFAVYDSRKVFRTNSECENEGKLFSTVNTKMNQKIMACSKNFAAIINCKSSILNEQTMHCLPSVEDLQFMINITPE